MTFFTGFSQFIKKFTSVSLNSYAQKIRVVEDPDQQKTDLGRSVDFVSTMPVVVQKKRIYLKVNPIPTAALCNGASKLT
jgi:hypothetical protein